MSTAVATDLTQDRFKKLMMLVKQEADARNAMVAAGLAPSDRSFDPESAISDILADAPSAAPMRDHVKGGLANQATPLPPEIKRVFTDHQAAVTKIINGMKTSTLPVTNQRVAEIKRRTGSNTAFHDKLMKIHENNVAEFTKKDTEVLNKLLKLGDEHREAQNAILATYQGFAAAFAKAWSMVASFFGKLVANITSWLLTAADKVVKSFKGVVNTVGNLIGGLF